ncbi:Transcription elongation factor GreA [hydrothermal vent metagenome]|uniref:Transcription elongation factor GreA n=1 Tax=hydrothermal vent metagenome TaxID=652676 RepID=A0A3B1B229_9ZZZZ
MSRAPMTSQGAEKLRVELKDLKGVQRPRVIQAIAVAREHGDLKENAEYHAAREQQSFIEGRILQIEAALSNSQIIEVSTVGTNAGGKVVFGATLELFDVEKDSEVKYQIVGEMEADIKQNLISITSPIARALIGKSVDDIAEVQAPGGVREYEIISVSYE